MTRRAELCPTCGSRTHTRARCGTCRFFAELTLGILEGLNEKDPAPGHGRPARRLAPPSRGGRPSPSERTGLVKSATAETGHPHKKTPKEQAQ